MEIPELKIELGDVNIRDLRSIEVPEWMAQPSYAIPVAPPVTTQVGVPIVNMPGCVEAHVDSKENQSLKDEDKDGKSKPDYTGAALDAVTAINPLGRGANILRNIPVGAGVASLARDAGLDKPVKDAARPIVQRVKGPKAITPKWLKDMIPDIPGKSSDQERHDTRYSY